VIRSAHCVGVTWIQHDICQDPENDSSGSWRMSSAHGLSRSLIEVTGNLKHI